MRPSRSIDYKKRWREDQANRIRENAAHVLRRTEDERLREAMRDTIRHIDNKTQEQR